MSKFIGKLANNRSILNRNYSECLKFLTRSNHYFVLPEIPSDTPETNALLRTNENLPSLNEITAKKIQTGFQKLLIDYEIEFNTIVDNLDKEKNTEKKFEQIFPLLEKFHAPLDYACKTARHLSFLKPYSAYYLEFPRINKKMNGCMDERYTNKKFYKILKELQSQKHLMSESQNRLVDRYLKYCQLNGLHFNEADQNICTELNKRIQDQYSFFKFRLQNSNKSFELRLSESMPMDEIPYRIKQMIAKDEKNPNKGPWTIVPKEEIFKSFMQHCSNRSLRKTLYDAYYSRASYVKEQIEVGTNNSEVIKNIINYRKDLAKLFKAKNYAQFKIENNAAVAVENVIDMIEKIRTEFKPIVDEDLKKLQKYSENEGNLVPLENHDVEFWRTKHTNQYFNVDQARVMQYFPVKKVINGLFELSKNLFNIEFRKDESQSKNLWDANVSAYNVFDENNQHISTLVIDPYLRNRKINHIWSYSGRESSLKGNTKPLAYLMMNAPNIGESSSLTFEQVEKVFSEFGRVINILLAQTDYTEFSDHNSTESDTFGLNMKLFERFAYQPEIINLVSAHQNTGEPLPIDILKRLKYGKSNFNLFRLMGQTYLSAFDIECHLSEKFWTDVCEELWPKFIPIPMSKLDFRACQFETSFAADFGCLYYSHLWSEMLASDVYEAFADAGLDNKNKLKEIGTRYRDTILKNGSSINFNELFRQFRGRNPSLDPLIKSYMPKRK